MIYNGPGLKFKRGFSAFGEKSGGTVAPVLEQPTINSFTYPLPTEIEIDFSCPSAFTTVLVEAYRDAAGTDLEGTRSGGSDNPGAVLFDALNTEQQYWFRVRVSIGTTHSSWSDLVTAGVAQTSFAQFLFGINYAVFGTGLSFVVHDVARDYTFYFNTGTESAGGGDWIEVDVMVGDGSDGVANSLGNMMNAQGFTTSFPGDGSVTFTNPTVGVTNSPTDNGATDGGFVVEVVGQDAFS